MYKKNGVVIKPHIFVIALSILLSIDPTAFAQLLSDAVVVTASDGLHVVVKAQDTARIPVGVTLYTSNWGYTSGTNRAGSEVVLSATTEPQHYTVSAVHSPGGDSDIPTGGLVLSAAPGDQAKLLAEHFKVGDSITVSVPVSKSISNTANAIDTPRGISQLIIFTPAFGPSTGSNAYGTEVTVERGTVIKVGGNNSPIPSDGFVLSGHGSAEHWLTANAMVGSHVSLNRLQIRITTDAASYVYQAATAVRDARDAIVRGRAAFINARFDEAIDLLTKSETQLVQASKLQSANPEQAVLMATQAKDLAASAYDYTLPSQVAEARGTWYRPVETSTAAVQQTLDHMQAAGINELYLETWFGGYTIYPSAFAAANHIEDQNPLFRGFDPLASFVSEGKKRGIAVHAWVDGFMVGVDPTGGPVLRAHPEWAARTRDHADTSIPTPASDSGYFWLDIANPEVRAYLLGITQEMVKTYGLAGINLDYTRFPAEADWHKSFGFSDYERKAYRAVSGVDPYSLSGGSQSDAWKTWQAWLSASEDQFVQDNYHAMKKISTQIVVSATPEPGAESDQIGRWSQYSDVVIPQCYSLGMVPPLVHQLATKLSSGNLIYAGVYPFFHRESPSMTTAEVLDGQRYVAGTVIFAFGEANASVVHALGQGAWREAAVSPGMHPIAATRAQLMAVSDDISSVYVPRQAMPVTIGREILKQIKSIDAALSNSTDRNLQSIIDRLTALADYVGEQSKHGAIKAIVADRLKQQCNELKTIIAYSKANGIS